MELATVEQINRLKKIVTHRLFSLRAQASTETRQICGTDSTCEKSVEIVATNRAQFVSLSEPVKLMLTLPQNISRFLRLTNVSLLLLTNLRHYR